MADIGPEQEPLQEQPQCLLPREKEEEQQQQQLAEPALLGVPTPEQEPEHLHNPSSAEEQPRQLSLVGHQPMLPLPLLPLHLSGLRNTQHRHEPSSEATAPAAEAAFAEVFPSYL